MTFLRLGSETEISLSATHTIWPYFLCRAIKSLRQHSIVPTIGIGETCLGMGQGSFAHGRDFSVGVRPVSKCEDNNASDRVEFMLEEAYTAWPKRFKNIVSKGDGEERELIHGSPVWNRRKIGKRAFPWGEKTCRISGGFYRTGVILM